MAAKTPPVVVRFFPNDKRSPVGKIADAELYFSGGPLDGLKLIGFSIWERKAGRSEPNVVFPARQYTVNGERRSFSLLRPILETAAQERLQDIILKAWVEYESESAQEGQIENERDHDGVSAGTASSRA